MALPRGLSEDDFWQLIASANYARINRARHYSGYKVGASGIGVSKQFARGESLLVSGGNTKLQSGYCQNKQCAEGDMEEGAVKAGIEALDYAAITADPHADDATGINFDMLINCGQCRGRSANGGSIFKPYTFTFLAHPLTTEQIRHRKLKLVAGWRYGKLMKCVGACNEYWHKPDPQ